MWEWYEVCCGEIGWTPEAFWSATIREAGLAVLGRSEAVERDVITQYEVGRMIGFFSVSVWTKKIKRVDQLIKFAWEETAELAQETVEYVKKRHEKFAHVFEKLKAIPWGEGKKINLQDEKEVMDVIKRVPRPNREA